MLAGLVAGDKLALLGGTYTFSSGINFNRTGTSGAPILVESYPGEQAVLTNTVAINGAAFDVTGSYCQLRRINFTNNNATWILILRGSNHLLEGVNVIGGKGTGITFYSTLNSVARDCVCGDLDSAGTPWDAVSGSGWADGFSIGGDPGSPSTNPIIDHCEAYRCTDDGFDNWGPSTNCKFTYCSSRDHPIAGGNGYGFKVAGGGGSTGASAERCIAYKVNTGFTPNGGGVLKIKNCTAWDTAFDVFFDADGNQSPSCVVSDNICQPGDAIQLNGYSGHVFTNNSWQRGGSVAFMSTTQ